MKKSNHIEQEEKPPCYTNEVNGKEVEPTSNLISSDAKDTQLRKELLNSIKITTEKPMFYEASESPSICFIIPIFTAGSNQEHTIPLKWEAYRQMKD